MMCGSVGYVTLLMVSIGVGGKPARKADRRCGNCPVWCRQTCREVSVAFDDRPEAGAINTVKRGVNAPGSSGRHRGWCADGPRRKPAMETSVGCGDGDVCNNSSADGARVTQETYV